MIRNSAKALVVHEGMLLLNRCQHKNGSIYYDLPGGGQNLYETMEDACTREVAEETGYQIRITGFAALTEEIYTDPRFQKQYPEYSHRILHIYRAALAKAPVTPPTVVDHGMLGSVWVPLEEIPRLPEMCPGNLQMNLPRILKSETPLYLGCAYMHWLDE